MCEFARQIEIADPYKDLLQIKLFQSLGIQVHTNPTRIAHVQNSNLKTLGNSYFNKIKELSAPLNSS